MNNDDPAPKYILAVDHTADYKSGYTYYALKSKNKAFALAEAATKATKAESVFCWYLLARKGKATKGFAEYEKAVRFYPNRSARAAADDFGDFEEDFSTDFGRKDWGTLSWLEIN